MNQCYIDLHNFGWRVYVVYLTSVILVVPSLLIAICYTHIVYTIWRKGRLLARQRRSRRLQLEAAAAATAPETDVEGGKAPATAAAGASDDITCQALVVESSCVAGVGGLGENEIENNNQVLESGASAKRLCVARRQRKRPNSLGSSTATEEEEEDGDSSSLSADASSSSDAAPANRRRARSASSASSSSSPPPADKMLRLATRTNLSSQMAGRDELATCNNKRADNNNLHTLAGDEFNLDDLYKQRMRRKQTKQSCSSDKRAQVQLDAEEEANMKQVGRNDRPTRQLALTGSAAAAQVDVSRRKASAKTALSRPLAVARTNSLSTGQRGARQQPLPLEAAQDYVAQQHGSGVIPRARIKTIKMTLVIVVAYILCWSPFCIINFCSIFSLIDARTTEFGLALSTLSQSLSFLNSAVNPIIFWLFSSKRNSPATGRTKPPQPLKKAAGTGTGAVAVGAATAAAGASPELALADNRRPSSSRHLVEEDLAADERSRSLCGYLCDWLAYLLCCCDCCAVFGNVPHRLRYRLRTDSRAFESTGTAITSRQQSLRNSTFGPLPLTTPPPPPPAQVPIKCSSARQKR